MSGDIRRYDSHSGGNGLRLTISSNGQRRWSKLVSNESRAPVGFDLSTHVTQGGTVDFIVDPVEGNDLSDGFVFTRRSSALPFGEARPSALGRAQAGPGIRAQPQDDESFSCLFWLFMIHI